MFERRMKILLAVFAVASSLLVYRLVDLQVKSDAMATTTAPAEVEAVPYKPISANRGRILTRGPGGEGIVELVSNEPCYELAVYYPVMDGDDWWINQEYRRILRQMRKEAKNPKLAVPESELALALHQKVTEFWIALSAHTNVPFSELLDSRDRIIAIIRKRIKAFQERWEETPDFPLTEQRLFYPLVTDLNEYQALELRGRLGDDPWAKVRPSVRRVYHHDDFLCHLLGRTVLVPGSSTPTMKKSGDDDYLPGEQQGKEGLELVYDQKLRGTRGWLKLGRQPKIETPPENGRDITLTIDFALQEYAQKRLREQIVRLNQTYATEYVVGGAAVVIDVKRNEVLALSSVPTFKPAKFLEQFNELKNDIKYNPLFNRALQGQYPPGSIVKPLVGAWAIDRNKTTSATTFDCRGFLSEKLHAFKCWRPPPGHGPMNFVDAIAHSCDVYFYHVGEMLTAEKISDFYRYIGFGESVPLGCSTPLDEGLANRGGNVPNARTRMKEYGHGMTEGDARNLAIGQGELLITPLQAAIMTQAIVTDRYRPPKILTDEPASGARDLHIGPNILRMAREGMFKVINDANATGYTFIYDKEDTSQQHELIRSLNMAGKTGSAQAEPNPIEWQVTYPNRETGEMVTETTRNYYDFRYRKIREGILREEITPRVTKKFPELLEKDKVDPFGREKHLAHGWFVGFAPYNDPRIVTVVLIEYGLAGGSGAGPVFRDIMLECKRLGYLK